MQPASGDHAMTDDWKWYASYNDEEFTVGPCDSREEVIELAKDEDLGLRQGPEGHWDRLTFWIVEASQMPVSLSSFIGDGVVETICEDLDEEHGGDDRYPTEDAWTDAQHADLIARMRAAADAWQAEHAIVLTPCKFTSTRNAEAIDITVPLPAN